MKSSKFKKKYKALITDVDGTLIPNSEDGMPSRKVIDAIAKTNKSIHIGVATSRPLFMLSYIFNKVPFSGPSIINGGAQIIDLPSGKTLWEQSIDSKSVFPICKILKKYDPNVLINDDGEEIEFSEKSAPKKSLTIHVLRVKPNVVEKAIKEISAFPNIAVHKIPSWHKGEFSLSITHAYATKQHAILEISKILNIQTHDIIGVGDGYNDFPLLMACGLKIAMGNAVDDLKEIADYIAPSVEEDGLSHVIEKFILN